MRSLPENIKYGFMPLAALLCASTGCGVECTRAVTSSPSHPTLINRSSPLQTTIASKEVLVQACNSYWHSHGHVNIISGSRVTEFFTRPLQYSNSMLTYSLWLHPGLPKEV